MRTSMKVILAAAGAAALASPVMAETPSTVADRTVMGRTWRTAPVPLSTDNVFWGLGYRRPHGYNYGNGYGGYGAAGYPHAGQRAPAAGIGPHPDDIDCVHVTFPQCGGGG